jgi:hypothetical protein
VEEKEKMFWVEVEVSAKKVARRRVEGLGMVVAGRVEERVSLAGARDGGQGQTMGRTPLEWRRAGCQRALGDHQLSMTFRSGRRRKVDPCLT